MRGKGEERELGGALNRTEFGAFSTYGTTFAHTEGEELSEDNVLSPATTLDMVKLGKSSDPDEFTEGVPSKEVSFSIVFFSNVPVTRIRNVG